MLSCFFFFFKQKTAYEMRISDWSSDVCSSDLGTTDIVLHIDAAETQCRGVAQFRNREVLLFVPLRRMRMQPLGGETPGHVANSPLVFRQLQIHGVLSLVPGLNRPMAGRQCDRTGVVEGKRV